MSCFENNLVFSLNGRLFQKGFAVLLLVFPHLLESPINLLDASFLLQGEKVEILVKEDLVILLEVCQKFCFYRFLLLSILDY